MMCIVVLSYHYFWAYNMHYLLENMEFLLWICLTEISAH